MAFRFIPDTTSIPFMKTRLPCLAASVVMGVLSILLVAFNGLNFGIEFQGGTLIEVRTEQPPDLGEMRSSLSGLGLGEVALQEFGGPNDILIRVGHQEGGEVEQQAAVERVRESLSGSYGGVEFRRVEVIGPKVSGELLQDGLYAVLFSLIAVSIYIWLRFEWQFGVGAVAALLHDVLLTLGLFSLLQLQFDLSTLAAILTIVGYSLNDTVVIFDRVRENLRRYRAKSLSDVLDLSVNQTLARTIVTGLTTFLSLSALFIFGPEVIRGFTFAMLWGVIIGTYSTIFISSPVLLYLNVRPEAAPADKDKGAGAVPAKANAKGA
ncbi:protein translocase subunit SecF [Marinivivus vitaminiproducens]|uniref:protein translocase subunit SecF n=1 Tax=Marinivivus vitaminiproducens TaxID=3035935 RepID=UPI0027A0DA73|nr:protein translocase subunit SecF [Geminicoccaceae bacterium SCSIO 64248]